MLVLALVLMLHLVMVLVALLWLQPGAAEPAAAGLAFHQPPIYLQGP